jgi:5-methylcytosine-specific restriction endonuclease McrA
MPRYDWAEIQRYYDEEHTYRECREKFGFAANSWTKAIQRGVLRPRPRTKPFEVVLISKSSRWAKKAKLIREGLLENRCSECGISHWRGKPLAIQIDHINGRGDDWRLENLRMLCPNCHSQTETFGGRNIRLRRLPGTEQIV